MSKKWGMFSILFYLFALVLSGCTTTSPFDSTNQAAQEQTGEPSAQAPKSVDPGKQIVIGVSVNALSNIHNQEMYDYTEQAIKAAGFKPVMVNANGLAVQQVSDIENLIQQNVDVIIIQNGDTDALKNVVKSAVDKGIHVISMDSGWIPGVSALFAKNDFEVGSSIYSMLAAEMGFEGEVITINHNDHPAIRARRNVQDAVLKEYANIKRVANVTSGFPGTVELAYKGVESSLQAHPNVKAIWATFDLEAVGAAQAVKAAGRDDIIIAGVDGEKEALQFIKEGGPIIATVVADMKTASEQVVQVAEKLARGEQTNKFYPIPYNIVTKENVDQYLQ
ncbi:sugar ABC transporter substrate-binding protein [Brevibacillus sp. B_LB10_24]|uniref:sugar ABC transporter substrate-binding protein n=1 Tax=Brevibacillus sp. B_LB10_24 TaxID=3380645 RepID=UPI0038BABF7F